jgi:beta-lactam-binding protein with PASTA domain
MALQPFLKNIYIRNLLGLILVSVVLILAVLTWLSFYTQHGKTVEVPDVKGLAVDKAKSFFDSKELNFSVVDSAYVKDAIPGTIAETTPPMGSTVKRGRTIYLKVNSYLPQLISIPDVKDSSQRQSLAMLRSLGFEDVQVKMVPGVYRDLVVGLESRGVSIEAGQRVPANTPLSLLVSSGSGDIMLLDTLDDSAIDTTSSGDDSWF